MTTRTYLMMLGLASLTSYAQPPRIVLHAAPIPKVTAKPGQAVSVKATFTIDEGYHVNSNKPGDPNLIPLSVTWIPGVLEKPSIAYPKPETANLAFSSKPVSIFSGIFEVTTQFKVAPRAAAGESVIVGKVRFQACNDRECLIPRTIDVSIPVEIVQ